MRKEICKTWATAVFEYHKKEGFIKKVGRAGFYDGMRYLERALYYDSKNNEYFVMLNGNVYNFRHSPYQNDPDLIKGFV